MSSAAVMIGALGVKYHLLSKGKSVSTYLQSLYEQLRLCLINCRLLTYIFVIHSHFNGVSLHCGHVHHVVSKHHHLGIPVILQLKYLLG